MQIVFLKFKGGEMMKKWKYRLELKDLWDKRNGGEITIQQMGKEISKRIKNLPCYKQEEDLEIISDDFEFIEDIDNFDNVLEQLYNWADYDKKCWIKTF